MNVASVISHGDDGETMDVVIKTMDDSKYTVTVPQRASFTVSELKEAIVPHTGLAVERQRLIHRGATLSNDTRLLDARIEHLTTVHLVARYVLIRAAVASTSAPTLSLKTQFPVVKYLTW